MMNRCSGWISVALLVMLSGCQSAVQYPPGSIVSPHSGSTATPPPNHGQPQTPAAPQVTGSQRLHHAWSKAVEGAFLGLHIGGPFGGAGGFTLGLLTGLLTADSHYGGLNSQILSEQQKDVMLEAAIEAEMERQRALESQITQASPAASETGQEGPEAEPAARSSRPQQNPTSIDARRENVTVASINKSAGSKTAPFRNLEIRDINNDGIPDLWIYFHPQKPDEVVRQEEATEGDGRVNSWSYFRDGKLVRRDLDTAGHGRADTIFYYESEQIAREERIDSGTGQIVYRATYQKGRLTRVEKDTGGRGKIDFWIYYDPRPGEEGQERVVKEEKDLNDDGLVDLWTYYEDGRVVRRDLSVAGLDYLTVQEKALHSAAPVDSSPATPEAPAPVISRQ